MKNLRENILAALIARYNAAIAEAKVNIEVLLESHVGVAEHPGTVETIDGELAKLAEAEDKLANIQKSFAAPIPPKVV
jgi:hypothetical protein